MKSIQKHYIAVAAALLLGSGAATAQNSIYYALGDSTDCYGTGTSKAETYNVAIHIDEPALVGAAIKGVRIAFPYTEGLSDASAWLSEQLPPVKSRKVSDPDVASKPFELAKGYTYVAFDEPYTLTEAGIYVGYAFTTAASDGIAYPVPVTAEDRPGGLYVHSTSTFRTAWHDLSGTGDGALAIQVLFEGDGVKGDAAGVGSVDELNVVTGQPAQGSFVLVNHGANGVSSIDYTLTLGDIVEEHHADLAAQPLAPVFSAQRKLDFTLPALEQKGSYDLTVTVTQVNGQPNGDVEASGQTLVMAYNTLPKHRPVLEEYTGTWCGYCPRGFVGLEEMQRLFPDDFIGISYHNDDPMEVILSGQYPWEANVLGSFPGFPAAALDRLYSTDAYCGFGTYGRFGIDQAWKLVAQVFAPAEVEVESAWADEGQTLTATAHVTFPVDRDDCPYELGFILVSDGLTGTASGWNQSNYYSGQTGWPASMDEFTQGDSYVSGLTYNFVFVARSGISGIPGSLTAPIVADVPQDYTYSFTLADIVNTSGQPIVQQPEALRVIALLYDKETGAILNANKAQAGASSQQQQQTDGIEQRPVADAASTAVWFDLQGRRVSHPAAGLYIRDGRKVVVK